MNGAAAVGWIWKGGGMRRRGVPIGGRRKDGCLKGWGWSIGSRGRDARGKKGGCFFFLSFLLT